MSVNGANGQSYDFGVDESMGTGYLMQSFSDTPQADTAEGRDGDGNVAVVKDYNARKEISFEAIVPTGETPPQIGETIVHDGVGYRVSSASKTQSNTDFTRFSVTAVHYTANNLPAAGSPSAGA